MVNLFNKSSSPFVCTLAHAYYCGNGECSCTVHEIPVPAATRGGKAGVRIEKRRVPASLGLMAGQRMEVKEEALRVPEVATAVARGVLGVERTQTATPPPVVVSPPTSRVRSRRARSERAKEE